MDKSRQQRRAEERRKLKHHETDAKAKDRAVRRIARINREREWPKLSGWQKLKRVIWTLFQFIRPV